jgi:HEAT repeat protein
MSENKPASSPETGGPLYAPETGFSLFLKLFIVPAAIVAVALGIFLLGTLAVQHPKTAAQYLEEFRSDSTSRRWQAALELSRLLTQGEKVQFDGPLRAELVQAFVAAKTDDSRVREYLALVLGSLQEKSAIPALIDAVQDSSINVKVNSLWALGNIEDQAGGPAALKALSDPDPGVELMAVGALNAIRYAPAKLSLEGNLENPSQPMRYNSAVALARLGDDKAVPVLLEMMNLKATGKPEEDQMLEPAKLSALEGAKALSSAVLHAKVIEMSQNDPSLKVREAALEILKAK